MVLLATAASVSSGCLRSQPDVATGVVIAVDGPSVAEVDRFSLRTAGGEVTSFRVGRLDLANGGLPAPHLRDHLVSGEPISVYHYGDEVVRYTDAAPPSP